MGKKRDVRVDRIGFVKELVSGYLNPLIEKVKGGMKPKQRIEGDLFEALLAPCPPARSIPPVILVRLFEEERISRKAFIASIKVSMEAAQENLDPALIEKYCILSRQAPRLLVTRQKGVEIKLVDAVRGLSAAIAAK